MKASNYNIFFPNEEKMIGYNTISDNFVILEPILHELFEASVNEGMVEELQNVHESLYDVLVDKGFVVEDNVDELELIKSISHETDFNETEYQLTINPTMNCNFKCWYCYETHIKDSKMSEDTLENIVAHVDKLLADKKDVLKKFKLQWFGGEPMLYFKKTVLPLLKEIYPKMKKHGVEFDSGFTTNGLLINQGVLDNCKKYGVSLFQITLDGHRERHNAVRFISESRGSYDEIVANMKLCLKNELHVSARINISAETISDLLLIIEDFKDITNKDKEYLTFSFHEVWQEEKNLTADISAIVNEFRYHNLKSTYLGESSASIKASCYADKKNHATINYNGDVFKCTARDFDEGSREGVLDESGAITWNQKYQKRIYDSRFSNKPCLECKILPVCNGGCSQHRMENHGIDYCVHNFDDHSKLQVVREKFFTRVASRAPSNHFNDAINQLLEINFNEFNKHDEEVFQETLSGFFLAEVREENLERINKINDICSKSILHLRKNEMEVYNENQEEINAILSSSYLNEHEQKVASLFALPVIAYSFYKKKDYETSLRYTNESILNDDLFLEKHPFLYGHKVQQLHNTIRVLFKAKKINEACVLSRDVFNHLFMGRSIEHEVGYWYEDLDITNTIELIGLAYQIFGESARTITDISNSREEEKDLFVLAFGSLLDINPESVSPELRPLLTFLDLKFSLLNTGKFEDDKVNSWVQNIKKVTFASISAPLFYSLFTSIGINSYAENKAEYRRVYA